MNSRFLGGILLIAGTSIGGGMLALPVANAATGFWSSSLFLLLCWAIMTLGAFFILEASLYLPTGTHMISMAAATMGNGGLLLAWSSYLFLLYTLLSAYISGSSDVLASLFAMSGITLSSWQSSLLFTLLFGLIVYGGIRRVDQLNRLLMFGKLTAYVILVVLIAPHIQIRYLDGGDARNVVGSMMILITSFGFAIIVPNLRDYFNDDVKTLKRVVFVGSLIPLICYLAWDAVIMGSLPTRGDQGLASLMNNEHATSALTLMLSDRIHNRLINSCFDFFTSICMLTAFLGVSLCLISFLADGLKTEQRGWSGLGLFALTFVPPLLIVLYYPGAYIHALNYAGLFCVILLLLLPVLMTVFGRHRYSSRYQVPGGRATQWLIIAVSAALLVNAVWQLVANAA